MTPSNQQRRRLSHRKTARAIKSHQVNHRLTGRRVNRNLTMKAALTDDVDPLASKPVPRKHVTDVKSTKLSRPQPRMDRKPDKRMVTQPKRLTRTNNREQLTL